MKLDIEIDEVDLRKKVQSILFGSNVIRSRGVADEIIEKAMTDAAPELTSRLLAELNVLLSSDGLRHLMDDVLRRSITAEMERIGKRMARQIATGFEVKP
jgi:hypothetical protein